MYKIDLGSDRELDIIYPDAKTGESSFSSSKQVWILEENTLNFLTNVVFHSSCHYMYMRFALDAKPGLDYQGF